MIKELHTRGPAPRVVPSAASNLLQVCNQSCRQLLAGLDHSCNHIYATPSLSH